MKTETGRFSIMEFLASKWFIAYFVIFSVITILEMNLFVIHNGIAWGDMFAQYVTVFIAWPIYWVLAKLILREKQKLFETPSEWKKRNPEAESSSLIERPPNLYDLLFEGMDEAKLIELRRKFEDYVENRKLIFIAFTVSSAFVLYTTFLTLTQGITGHVGLILDHDLRETPVQLVIELVFNTMTQQTFAVIVLIIGYIFLAFRFIANLDQHVPIVQLEQLRRVTARLEDGIDDDEMVLLQNYTSFSFRIFRRNAKPISDLATKMMLVGTGGFILVNFWIYLLLPALEVELDPFFVRLAVVALIVLDVLLLVAIILLFFYPQRAVNKWLSNGKHALINILEKLHRDRLSEYLSMSRSEEAKEQRTTIAEEITFLETQIHNIDSILTWPFNYKQIGALIVSIGTSGASFVAPFIINYIQSFSPF